MQTLPKKQETHNFPLKHRPEIDLLLYFLHPQIDDNTSEHIQNLTQEKIDWQSLIHIAYTHGVLALLYTRINIICPQNVPASVLSHCRNIYQSIVARNLFLTGELFQILKLLKEQGIVAIPYKGPVLSTKLYNNFTLRQFVDLDILVQPEDIFTVKKLLLTQGYRPRIEMTHTEEITYLKSANEHTYDFIHDAKEILIEIHWRIAPKCLSPIEPKDLWQDLQPLSLAGMTIDYLPLEDWLPILCVHGSRHIWTKLAWLCDIATLVHKYPDLNWHKVLQQATKFGCKRMLLLGLVLAHELLGVTLPVEIEQQLILDSKITAIVPRVYNQLFDDIKTSERFLGRTFYHIQVRERWQDKALYIQSFFYWLMMRRVFASL